MKFKNYLLGLLGGLIIFIGLSSFCSAGTIVYTGTTEGDISIYIPYNSSITNGGVGNATISCSVEQPIYGYKVHPYIYYYDGRAVDFIEHTIGTYSFSYDITRPAYRVFFSTYSPGSPMFYTCTFSGVNILSEECDCPTCPSQYTSEECQIEYGLITTGVLNECIGDLTSCQSSLSGCQLDLNSCQSSLSGWDNSLNNCSNNLLSCQSSLSSCIAGNCPLDNGDNIQWSSLFINNIQHIGAPLININIPEEISWDYTSSTGSFDLDVEGYNVDSDYIEGVINIQNSKPTKEDFNNIITGLIPLFVPGLVIILFIYFVFKFIKKIF